MYGFTEMMMEEAEKQFSQEGRETMTKERLAIGEAIHAMKWLDQHFKGWGLEEECAILENICSNYEKKEIQTNHNYLDLQYQLDGAESEIERLREEIKILKMGEKVANELILRGRVAEERIEELENEIERLRAENEEALESLTAAYLLGRHEKAHEQAARPKEGKIDSSEHVTEPTKMIGFDLERARVEVDTASARRFSESREQARIFCAEEILPDALDEIERLRPFEIAARDLDSDLTKIAGERDDQAARIKELEDALAEERAKYNLSWKDCAYRAPDTYCEKTHNYCTSEDCPLLDEQKTEARRQLRAEGKIGPDANHIVGPDQMVPNGKVWQITEERKAAIDRGLQFLEWSYAKNSALDTKEQIAVLWAMLDEVGQCE